MIVSVRLREPSGERVAKSSWPLMLAGYGGRLGAIEVPSNCDLAEDRPHTTKRNAIRKGQALLREVLASGKANVRLSMQLHKIIDIP